MNDTPEKPKRTFQMKQPKKAALRERITMLTTECQMAREIIKRQRAFDRLPFWRRIGKPSPCSQVTFSDESEPK